MVLLVCVLASGLSLASQASAVEPVFDTAFDAQLGDILRIKNATNSDDYLALELEGKRARAGSITSQRVMGQLGRLRSEIGAAPPLRFLSMVGAASGPATIGQYFDRAADAKWTLYTADWVPPVGFYTWMYEGRTSAQALCTNSSGSDPGVAFHRLRVVSGPCEVESQTNWNDAPSGEELRFWLGGAPGNNVEYGGCAHTPVPFVVEPSPCVATWIPTHDFWEIIEVGNTQPYGSQDIDQAVSTNPFNTWAWSSAPPSQTDALTAGRDLLDDADYTLVRQWLNHRLDPEHYPAPVDVRQTLGAVCDSNLAPTECEQARR